MESADANNVAGIAALQGAIRTYKEFSDEGFADRLLDALEAELNPLTGD